MTGRDSQRDGYTLQLSKGLTLVLAVFVLLMLLGYFSDLIPMGVVAGLLFLSMAGWELTSGSASIGRSKTYDRRQSPATYWTFVALKVVIGVTCAALGLCTMLPGRCALIGL